MKKILFFVLLGTQAVYCQQQAGDLTVEKIMRDPKWIGTSPGGIYWNYSGQSLYFNWNPGKATSDSTYQFTLQAKEPQKILYREALRSRAIRDGVYNEAHTRI